MAVLPRHEVALEIGGSAYLGWTEIRVLRGIGNASGAFDLSMASKERTAAEDWPIADGAACRVTLGGKVLITGWIDEVARAISADERRVTVRGRDKTADLVDCSAIHKPGSWRGQKLETIARELLAPFAVELVLVGDTGAPFKRFALQQGETVFSAIERMARYRGLAVWSAGAGELRVGNPDTGARTGRIEQGVNVISAEARRDVSDRFSEYQVKGQSSGDDSRNGKQAAQVSATAKDAEITRYRPMLVIGEEQSDVASLSRRAEWEAAVRSGRGKPAQVTVPGWYCSDGSVWEIGARAACKLPACRVEGDMLVEQVELARNSDQGTVTVLSIVPPEAWTQLAEPEPTEEAA